MEWDGAAVPPHPGVPGRGLVLLQAGEGDGTERHLLYVACTRARDFLLVTSTAPASEVLDDPARRNRSRNEIGD